MPTVIVTYPTRLVVVSTACGLFLLTAVVLKVQGLASGVGQPLALFAPWVQMAGVQAEAIVGFWLLSGYARRGAWLAGFALFSMLAAVSVYLIVEGQKSCGCFGRVEMSPWVSLTLDVTCVLSLSMARPTGGFRRTAVWQMTLVAASIGVMGLLASSTVAERLIARLRGDVVILPNGDVDMGSVPKGESRTLHIVVENISDEPVRLIGGTSSCSCTVIADLPQTIQPHSQLELRVAMRLTGEVGLFTHNFEWYTDCQHQPRVTGRLTGRVLKVRTEQPATTREATDRNVSPITEGER
jgi:hypothetical protein